jgi:hypothetical protein
MAKQEERGFWGTVSDMRKGISSADRARMERKANMDLQEQELRIANANATVTKNANADYGLAREALLKEQDMAKKKVGMANSDEVQIAIIQDEYNDKIKLYNDALKKRKKRMAKQYKASGVYDFKPTETDNYEVYLEQQDMSILEEDEYSDEEETTILSKEEWENKRTLENMEEQGLFDFEEFEELNIVTTEKDGEKHFVFEYLDKDGNLKDTDNLGTVDTTLKMYGGGNEAELKGDNSAKVKIAETKEMVKYLQLNKEELGLTPEELKKTVKTLAGVKETDANKIREYGKNLKEAMPNLSNKQINSLKLSYAQHLAGVKQGTTKELDDLMFKRNQLWDIKEKNGKLSERQQADLSTIEDRITKLSQPSMNSLKISLNTIKEIKTGLTEQLAKTNPAIPRDDNGLVDFTRLDMSKLTRSQKSDVRVFIDAKRKALNPVAFEKSVENTMKTNESLGIIVDSIGQLITEVEHGDNINFVEQFYKEAIGEYVGLTDEQLKDTALKSQVAGAFNIIKNALFGATQSTGEMASFKTMAGSLYNTNEKLIVGMRTLLNNSIAKIEANKMVMGDEAFNVIFGERQRRLLQMRDVADEFIANGGKSKKSGGKVVIKNNVKKPSIFTTEAYQKAQENLPAKNNKPKTWRDY